MLKSYIICLISDYLFNKIIQTEYKLQGLIRQHQDAEETLKKTLWGESSRKNSNSSDRHKFHDEYLSRLKIKHAKTTTVNKQTSTYSTSYNSLARDDIIDRTEKMTNIPTLPSYIENNLYLPSVSQGHSMSYFKPNSSTVSSMKQASLMLPTASNLISKSKELKKSFQLSSSTLLYPLSPIKRPNNFSSTSIQRGYTPTGKVRETVSGYAQDIYNDKLLQAGFFIFIRFLHQVLLYTVYRSILSNFIIGSRILSRKCEISIIS